MPTLLHTPLMSGTNAIHGIVLIGGDAHPRLGRLGRSSRRSPSSPSSSATVNIVGGFLVTDRMLDMFKRKPREETRRTRMTVPLALSQNVVNLMYVVAAIG